MAKSPVHGICRLCKQQERLVNSHVVPDFNYTPLKAKEGLFYVLSTDLAKKELKRQKGITENLLCAKCDNVRLQRYEDHLARVLFGGITIESKVDGRLLVSRGYDYKRLKNGLLSILWRMSISTNPFFREVNLGSKHEERLRQALLNDEEFEETEFPVVVTAPFLEGRHIVDLILSPDFARIGGNRVYRCVISGLLFTYFVGSAPIDATTTQLILRRAKWPILKADVAEIPFLHHTFLQIGRSNLLRGERTNPPIPRKAS